MSDSVVARIEANPKYQELSASAALLVGLFAF